ncbi:MAG: hypothetical protein NTU58_04055 [Candidatus Nealsonbacteria bacterium]|nr:hypothetical protein [Candidatus Nealsonbacteria bacterium]
MNQNNILAIFFLMGLILGGVSGALYVVASVKYHKINFEQLKYSAFKQLVILFFITIFVVLLAIMVF